MNKLGRDPHFSSHITTSLLAFLDFHNQQNYFFQQILLHEPLDFSSEEELGLMVFRPLKVIYD